MVEYLAPIDPHVHLRGEEYPDHNFLIFGFRDAKMVGLAAVLEQPNPTPWLTSANIIRERLAKAEAYTGERYHGIHVGLTNNPEQVRHAMTCVNHLVGKSNSDKTFYVHSTGNMGILDEDLQKHIWWMKSITGYKGVSIGHFEDEASFKGKFDSSNPISHSERQTSESELVQVERQLRFARDMGFMGTFYIAHVSNPDTVDYVLREEKHSIRNIILEATFHHTFLNTEDYKIHGNRVKMNPPLRTQKEQEKLLQYVLEGKIHILGTDHAPHPIQRKDSNEPPSGIPALPFWPKGIELLRKNGISEEQLENLVFKNSNSVFRLGLNPNRVDVQYDPRLWDVYGYNPFSRVDK